MVKKKERSEDHLFGVRLVSIRDADEELTLLIVPMMCICVSHPPHTDWLSRPLLPVSPLRFLIEKHSLTTTPTPTARFFCRSSCIYTQLSTSIKLVFGKYPCNVPPVDMSTHSDFSTL